jgi:hypothetical protein
MGKKSKIYNGSKKELITRLKNNDNEAWEAFLRIRKGAKDSFMYRLYGVYGAEEMSNNGLTEEECVAVMDAAMVEAVQRFEYDEEISEDENFKKLCAYTTWYLSNDLRRTIEKYNGVSKYMAGYLLRIKKLKLDLWESSDEELIDALMSMKSKIKDFKRLLANIREYFGTQQSYSAENTQHEHYEEPVQEDPFEDVAYRVRAEKVKKIVGEKNYRIFYEYYLQDAKHIPLVELSQRYDMSVDRIKIRLDYVKNVYREEYADEAKMFASKEEQSFLGKHSHESIEEIFEIL